MQVDEWGTRPRTIVRRIRDFLGLVNAAGVHDYNLRWPSNKVRSRLDAPMVLAELLEADRTAFCGEAWARGPGWWAAAVAVPPGDSCSVAGRSSFVDRAFTPSMAEVS